MVFDCDELLVAAQVVLGHVLVCHVGRCPNQDVLLARHAYDHVEGENVYGQYSVMRGVSHTARSNQVDPNATPSEVWDLKTKGMVPV